MRRREQDFDGSAVSRRALLGAGGTSLVVAVAGCDAFTTEPAGDEDGDGGAAAADKGKEAPTLAEMVDAGDLPPVEERLPSKPLVVEPVERVGVYGGEWHTAMAGAADSVWLIRTIGYDNLMAWDLEFQEPNPNIAESVDVSDDARVYTFHLREGMKWSDGEPFTADDIVFWYEDVQLNEDIAGVMPLDLTINGEPPELEKVDDYTVRFTFPEPYGLFLHYLAVPVGRGVTQYPRHYLEQFHQDYAEEVDSLARQEGFDDWVQLFTNKADPWANPELPTRLAWRVTIPLGEGNRVVAERNPYYFKTDPDGSQLPYLDRVVYDVVTDAEVILLKATNGELNMHSWHINTPSNKPVVAQSREGSDYRFFDMKWAWMNRMIVMLNLNVKDAALAEVFQNRDFRIGLSYAMNRDELIDAVFQRQGEPWQAAPHADSDFYDEELAKQYTEYDPDRANEHLDRAGYSERDGEGFRLRPDGQRISFPVTVPFPASLGTYFVDAMEMVVANWAEVGVDAQVDSVSRELWVERQQANEHDATVWMGDGGLYDALLDPRYYFPYRFPGWSLFAGLWANWYWGVDPNEEPPEAAQQQMELFDQVKGTLDPEEQKEIFRQLLQIAKEEFWVIGTVLPAADYGVVRNNFHNVPEPMILAWMYPTPGPTRPEQYFIDG